MLESGSSGSVRGASSNGRPYREPRSRVRIAGTTPRGHVCDAPREAAPFAAMSHSRRLGMELFRSNF
jgi:hypothetical protein